GALRPGPCRVGVDFDVYDRVVGERLPDRLDLDCAAAERDQRRPGAIEQLEHQLALTLAERGLALALEEVGDRLPEPLLEEQVRVERLPAGPRGEISHRPG